MASGGKRAGAGRPKGSGKHKEETKVVRIPISKVGWVKRVLDQPEPFKVPLYCSKVAAGFPSPADDYIEAYLDFNTYLIQNPASTFTVRAEGQSMIGAGIFPGDLLIVDRSVEAIHGKIVIAAINGELTVKRLYRKNGIVQLCPENEEYSPIDITREDEAVIWGVVISVVRRV